MNNATTAVSKMAGATIWSFLTEIFSSLMGPIIAAILARLLAPEAFGFVATINMVISFTNLLTDAGFQKFIIQHEFKDTQQQNDYINVAFWSNFILSLVLMLFLIFGRNAIAQWTNTPGLGLGIAIAALNLPISSFSSIQMAFFKRNMSFNTLFSVRVISIIIPLLITIPLAFYLRSYWALVLGALLTNFVRAVLLTYLSEWKPSFSYNWQYFKDMFSFCYWILIESILVWITGYMGIFIIGHYLSIYEVGLYRTSIVTISSCFGIVIGALSPVLFAVTSRLQNQREKMYSLFLTSLRRMGLLLFPFGVGIYLYRDLITSILLGNQWGDAADFIGLWAITHAIMAILVTFWDGMFNAIGKPKYSVFTQLIYIFILLPLLLIGAHYGYKTLYLLRCVAPMAYIPVQLFTVKYVFHISLGRSLRVIVPSVLCSIPMIIAAVLMRKMSTYPPLEFLQIGICIAIYTLTLWLLPATRKDLETIINKLIAKIPTKLRRKIARI